MSELIQIFMGAMVVSLSGALAPGPMLALVISSVSEKGFWTSFFIVLGHSILELLLVIAFVAGIFRYINSPVFMKIIGISGGTILMYMGGNILHSVIKNKVKINLSTIDYKSIVDSKFIGAHLLKGVVVSAINPYWYIWWFTIGIAFLTRSAKFSFSGVSSFFVGHISADFIWYLFIGILISKGKRFFNQKIYNIILILCSLVLFYFAINFFIEVFNRQW